MKKSITNNKSKSRLLKEELKRIYPNKQFEVYYMGNRCFLIEYPVSYSGFECSKQKITYDEKEELFETLRNYCKINKIKIDF